MQCPHRPPCPGCPRFGEPGLGAHAASVLARLATNAEIAVAPLITGAPFAFRHRARLAVRGRASSPKIGIFQAGSHRIVDIPSCPIHHPLINDIAAAVKAAMRRLAVAPYADRPHRGLVRYLQVAVERATERAQVVIVANDTTPEACDPLAAELADALGTRLHSLWWNGNPVRTNVILGDAWHRWAGPEAITDQLGGVPVFFPPGAFGQANATVLDALVDTVHLAVPPAAHVLELYAGVGAFGLGLLARGAHVAFNEIDAAGVSGLRLGLAQRSDEERARASVLPGPAEAHVDAIEAAEAVVADPPRRGLGDAMCAALSGDHPARVVLVSCDVDALARDVSTLTTAGRRLRSLVPLACFPYTEQVETVAVLDAG